MEVAISKGSVRQKRCPWIPTVFSQELWTVLVMGCVIFLLDTAYIPVESLQSSLNSDSGLGTLSLASMYGPYVVFAIASPAIIRVFTAKWTVFIALSANVVFLGTNFYPTWFTLIPSCVLVGCMIGPFWTVKDLYISEMAKRSAKKSSQNVDQYPKVYQNKLSFYNGIIFGGNAFAGVLGQLISSVVLTQSSNQVTFEESCGAFHCGGDILLQTSNGTNTTMHELTKPDKVLVYTILGILTSFVCVSMVITAFGLRRISFEKINQSLRRTILSCSLKLTDRRMILIIPQMFLFGFSHGIILSDYTRSYVTCGKGIAMLGYLMISKDICSTVAALTCGRLVKYTGRQIQVGLALIGYVGFYTMMWVWIPSSEDHVTVYVVIPAIFGISDVVLHNHICTLLALVFEDDKAAAFSIFYALRALSKCLSFGLSGILCVWMKLAIVTVILALACVSFIIFEASVIQKKPTTEKEEMAIEIMLPKDVIKQ